MMLIGDGVTTTFLLPTGASVVAEVLQDIVADWMMRLPELTTGYALADIYNTNETGLYYRAQHSPSRTEQTARFG